MGHRKGIELRHLRYFAAVAEHLSFIKAAKELHISQPPLSRQVHDLEEEIGALLFDRSKKRLRLTEAGLYLRGEARRILDEVAMAERTARLIDVESRERINVGCISFAFFSRLSPLFDRVRARLPGIKLDVRVISTEAQEGALRSGLIDLGFARSWLQGDGLVFRPLLEEQLVLLHPAAMARPSGDLADFARQPFIAMSRSSAPGLAERIQDFCARSGLNPPAVYECEDVDSAIKLVAAGSGWTILPDYAFEPADADGLGSIRLPLTFTLGICHREETLSGSILAVIEAAEDYFAGG